MSASALRCEVLTMQMIKRETTMPIPEVYHFDDTLDNELKYPFILMKYMNGHPLHEVWFDLDADPEVLEQRRCRALDDIARVMVQLNRFVFPKAGQVLFDGSGEPCGVGLQRMVDMQATLDSLHGDDHDGSFKLCTVWPFGDAKEWFLCMLDRRSTPPDEYGAGTYKLFRLFIVLPFPSDGSLLQGRAEFVLAHPDLDIQNVIVSEDGGLLGFVDWDNVGTVPRFLGNDMYPSWLTGDWDAMMYRYDENAAPGPDCPNNTEILPTELEHYRDVYRNVIEQVYDESNSSPSAAATAKGITSNSLLLHNLYIAVIDPVCKHDIVARVFKKIKRITAPSEPHTEDREDADDDKDKSDGEENANDNADADGDKNNHESDEDGDEGDSDDFYAYDVLTEFERGELSDRNMERLTRGLTLVS